MSYHHGVMVKKSIDLYSSININVINKKHLFHLAHDMTIWNGKRQKFEQRRMILTDIIHAILMCDQSNRLYDIHIEILSSESYRYEKPLLSMIKSIQCH